MGLDVAATATSEWVEVVPDFRIGEWNNLSELESVRLEIRPLNVWDDAQVKRRFMEAHKPGPDQDARCEALARDIIRTHARNVVNYRVRGVSITSGELLAAHGQPEIRQAVFAAIVDVSELDAALKKTLAWQSRWQSPAVKCTGGVAESAADRATQ